MTGMPHFVSGIGFFPCVTAIAVPDLFDPVPAIILSPTEFLANVFTRLSSGIEGIG